MFYEQNPIKSKAVQEVKPENWSNEDTGKVLAWSRGQLNGKKWKRATYNYKVWVIHSLCNIGIRKLKSWKMGLFSKNHLKKALKYPKNAFRNKKFERNRLKKIPNGPKKSSARSGSGTFRLLDSDWWRSLANHKPLMIFLERVKSERPRQ